MIEMIEVWHDHAVWASHALDSTAVVLADGTLLVTTFPGGVVWSYAPGTWAACGTGIRCASLGGHRGDCPNCTLQAADSSS